MSQPHDDDVRALLLDETERAHRSMPPFDDLVRNASVRRRRRRVVAATMSVAAAGVVAVASFSLFQGHEQQANPANPSVIKAPTARAEGSLAWGVSSSLFVTDEGCPHVEVGAGRAGVYPAGTYVLFAPPVKSPTMHNIDGHWEIHDKAGQNRATQGEDVTFRPAPRKADDPNYTADDTPCRELIDEGALPAILDWK